MGFSCSSRTLFLTLSLSSSLWRWNSSRLKANAESFTVFNRKEFIFIGFWKLEVKRRPTSDSLSTLLHSVYFSNHCTLQVTSFFLLLYSIFLSQSNSQLTVFVQTIQLNFPSIVISHLFSPLPQVLCVGYSLV